MRTIHRSSTHACLVLAVALTAVGCAPAPSNGRLAAQSVISFDGTRERVLLVTATGPWTITAMDPWMTATPSSGTGATRVMLTVQRSGLMPGNYQSRLTVNSGSANTNVGVFMGFPNLRGNVNAARQTRRTEAAVTLPPTAMVAGQISVTLSRGGVAVSAGMTTMPRVGDPPVDAATLCGAARALAMEYGIQLRSCNGTSAVFSVPGAMPGAMSNLALDGRVRSVAPLGLVQTTAVPDDPRYGEQWHYPLINLPQAWDLTTGSAMIPIGIADTGILGTHEDLRMKLEPGWDFVENNDSNIDVNGHGTHVAGTVGASSNNATGVAGVAWLNPLVNLRVLGPMGGSNEDIANAIRYAAGQSVTLGNGQTIQRMTPLRVVNLSLGPPNGMCVDTIRPSEAMASVVREALAAGVNLVFAAGNDNCNVISSWAAIPGVITVASVGPGSTRAPYSNAGPEVWVTAPGGDTSGGEMNGVLSPWSDGMYRAIQGTSMAAPHVAGVIGLVLAANPALTPVQVRQILEETSTPIMGADANASGAPNMRGGMGHGLINAQAAVMRAMNFSGMDMRMARVEVRPMGDPMAPAMMVEVDQGGNFQAQDIAPGMYSVRVGVDADGDGMIGEMGEYYDEGMIEVAEDEDGESELDLDIDRRM
ncbi:MAG: S8 family serine peptidase [Deltaproteobacteria bacterium]|nr:S8 family serine peptidase [Deltaproteobacteria bacterium]